MVMTYIISQLMPIRKNLKSFLIVMATGNLDEALTGYFTKYDCSSGDLNLIGSLNKMNIRACMKFLHEKYGAAIINEIIEAPSSAELVPPTGNQAQNDEEEIGMTFEQLNVMNDLRMKQKCGIVSIFESMVD